MSLIGGMIFYHTIVTWFDFFWISKFYFMAETNIHNKRKTAVFKYRARKEKREPWASWSPSVRSSWWWGRPLTPQTSWWQRSAPCPCSCTWTQHRRNPLRSSRSSRTSPCSGPDQKTCERDIKTRLKEPVQHMERGQRRHEKVPQQVEKEERKDDLS